VYDTCVPLIRAATRGSRLALWQTDRVAAELSRVWPDLAIERVLISTRGDQVQDVPLSRIGDKGLFTRELEDALEAESVHFAVHSLKDLPTRLPDGFVIAAVLERADARDALVAASPVTIDALPRGARVGTSSLRRRAQLLARRPDLDVRDLRGNVPTRVDKVLHGDLDAAVLALAGLTRLDLTAHVVEVLDADVMLPAPGQGALAVEIKANARDIADLLAPLNHAETRRATTAERALLGELEGGCQVPVGAFATATADGRLHLAGGVFDLDGRDSVRASLAALVNDDASAVALGRDVAARLRRNGADAILARVRAASVAHPPAMPEP